MIFLIAVMFALGLGFGLMAAERWFRYQRCRKEAVVRTHGLYGKQLPHRQAMVQAMAERFDHSGRGQTLSLKLARANLRLRPFGYEALRVGALLLLYFFGAQWLQLAFPLDMLMPWVATWLIERFLFKARQGQFAGAVNKQLVEAARLLSSGLRAGMSVQQCFELASKELAKPASAVFGRCYQEMQLGVPIPDALDNMLMRVRSPELALLVNSLVLHHNTGGDLAHALDLIASTLSEREQTQSQVDSAIAEQRVVAQILPVLPVACALMMNMFIPGFLNPLFRPLGLVVLGVFIALQAAAMAVIRRMARIEV